MMRHRLGHPAHLFREFAGGTDDEDARTFGFGARARRRLLAAELVNDGEEVREGFPAAGVRRDEVVAAGGDARDGSDLNVGGLDEAERVRRGEDVGVEAEVGEGSGGDDGTARGGGRWRARRGTVTRGEGEGVGAGGEGRRGGGEGGAEGEEARAGARDGREGRGEGGGEGRRRTGGGCAADEDVRAGGGPRRRRERHHGAKRSMDATNGAVPNGRAAANDSRVWGGRRARRLAEDADARGSAQRAIEREERCASERPKHVAYEWRGKRRARSTYPRRRM